jgi:hypothetical protein
MQSKYKVKMVADPDPLSRVLQYCLQRAIAVCEHGDLSNEGQAVPRSKLRTPDFEGEKRSLKGRNSLTGGFLAKW